MANFFSIRTILVLAAIIFPTLNHFGASAANESDQSALMNIWNYQIERKVKTSIQYKMQDLAVWEEVDTMGTPSPAARRYYVTPPANLIPSSAACQFIAITNSYEVVYDIQLWEKELPSAVVAGLKELGLEIREDQIHPLPFYQARVIWNNVEQQLVDLKLAAAWINNLKQQQVYQFKVAAVNNRSCNLLADTIRLYPEQFVNSIQLQFTVAAAKIDSKMINVKSEHISSSELVASLKNMPGAEGSTRYLSSKDYNRMLWQISNQIIATEVTSGDYVDADDELSLKEIIGQMFQTQKENTAQFDDKMWNSVFWDPLDERPDKITAELNHMVFINQTDHRAYLTQSGTGSTSGQAKILGIFGGGGSHTSSSSLTTDEMGHLLESYDIQSEIQGEKFVPKKLDLVRLNVNDLSRQDLVATKRLRVRQVDIGGVLQIGIGNSSFDTVFDENRYLRQQLTDLQEALRDDRFALGSFKNETQVERDKFRNDIWAKFQTVDGNMAALRASLQSDIGALQSQAEHFHPYSCQRIEAPTCPCPNLGILGKQEPSRLCCKDYRNVICPDGKLLSAIEYVIETRTDPATIIPGTITCC